MSASFQQKTRWWMFASLALAFGLYFAMVWPVRAPQVLPAHIVLFVAMVVLLVVAQVLGHALIAWRERHVLEDERDRLYALRGARNGGLVLATAVFAALCTALLSEGNFLFTHVLLAGWVIAQLTEIGTQLLLHHQAGR